MNFMMQESSIFQSSLSIQIANWRLYGECYYNSCMCVYMCGIVQKVRKDCEVFRKADPKMQSILPSNITTILTRAREQRYKQHTARARDNQAKKHRKRQVYIGLAITARQWTTGELKNWWEGQQRQEMGAEHQHMMDQDYNRPLQTQSSQQVATETESKNRVLTDKCYMLPNIWWCVSVYSMMWMYNNLMWSLCFSQSGQLFPHRKELWNLIISCQISPLQFKRTVPA